jgi:hypothetical protein
VRARIVSSRNPGRMDTELIRDLDPEDARALVDPVLHITIEAAQRYESYVVMMTFSPQTREEPLPKPARENMVV